MILTREQIERAHGLNSGVRLLDVLDTARAYWMLRDAVLGMVAGPDPDDDGDDVLVTAAHLRRVVESVGGASALTCPACGGTRARRLLSPPCQHQWHEDGAR